MDLTVKHVSVRNMYKNKTSEKGQRVFHGRISTLELSGEVSGEITSGAKAEKMRFDLNLKLFAVLTKFKGCVSLCEGSKYTCTCTKGNTKGNQNFMRKFTHNKMINIYALLNIVLK